MCVFFTGKMQVVSEVDFVEELGHGVTVVNSPQLVHDVLQSCHSNNSFIHGNTEFFLLHFSRKAVFRPGAH